MRSWPKSFPDYQWPAHFLSPGMAAVRGLLAVAFHAFYALGRLAGLLSRRGDRVLVLRTDGMGDALLFEPALESLARAVSPRVVHMWAPKLTCELLALCPSVHRFLVVPRGFKQGNLAYFRSFRWRAQMGWALGRWSFDKVIYPAESPEPLGNWLFASVRARERWLNFGDTINQFEWQRTQSHSRATHVIENRPGNAHELVRNEYLASQWSPEKQLRLPRLYIGDAAMARANRRVAQWQIDARRRGGRELIGVVPGASMPVNSYPASKLSAALKRIWDEYQAVPLLLGGRGDGAAMDRLEAELVSAQVPVLKLDQPLRIQEVAGIVRQLDGIISVDTGLAHVAVAQQVPSVILVGGGNPGRFFPWPGCGHHLVLTNSMPCSGCNNRCELDEPECITHITPDEIVAAWARLKGRRIGLDVYVAPHAKPGHAAHIPAA